MNDVLMVELRTLSKVCNPGKREITPETLALYAADLEDLPLEAVVQAIREVRKTSTFFPSVAEIRDRVVSVVGSSVLVDAESAWGEVLREVRRVGVAGKRTAFVGGESRVIAERSFSSPLIERAVESIGWKDICMAEEGEMDTIRAQFRDSLRAIQRRGVDQIISGRAVTAFMANLPESGGLRPVGEFAGEVRGHLEERGPGRIRPDDRDGDDGDGEDARG